MKFIYHSTIALFFLSINAAFAQGSINDTLEPLVDSSATELTDHKIYVTAQNEWPEFPGGSKARNKFIADHLQYPKEALKEKIEGRVIIGFTVEKDSTLTEFRMLKGVHPSLDAEAMRVAQLMPKWKPGKNVGNVIRSRFKIDIVFILPENREKTTSSK